MAEIRLTTKDEVTCPIIYRVEQASQVLVQDFVHQQ